LKRAAILTVTFIFILLPSCQDEVICTQDLVAKANAGFYVRDASGQRDTLVGSFIFYSVLRPDSMLYDASSGIHRIRFPLPQSPAEYTAFVMENGSLADTIIIHYSTRLELVSFSCGFAAVHDLERLEYGNRIIDTISIANPLVDLTDDENLKIYIRPAVADTAG
jgi:hypothetical protein